MFPRQVLFYICRRFLIGFLKMAARAVLHFRITCEKTSIVPGTQTALRSMATPGICSCASLLSARRSVRTVIAGDFQLLPDNACSLS